MKFTKMQGLGNDFIILDYDQVKEYTDKVEYGPKISELAKKLCDRHFSIGADGLIIVNPNVKNSDIGWLFYNSDGSIAQMCGNGMRCFAKYVYDKGLVKNKKFKVETLTTVIIPEILENNDIKVNMNTPILEPVKIPCKKVSPFEIEGFSAYAVSMGNPHCIIFTDSDTKKLALEIGPKIEVSALFPEKTNVEFVKIINKNEIILDVFERGCGITLACGTGACASVVAGIIQGLLENKVKVNLPGGALTIEWAKGENDPVYMIGSATYVFKGEI